ARKGCTVWKREGTASRFRIVENEPIRFHVAGKVLARIDDGTRLKKALRYLKEFLTIKKGGRFVYCQKLLPNAKNTRKRCQDRSALDFGSNSIDDPIPSPYNLNLR